jgi:hypothetical protein
VYTEEKTASACNTVGETEDSKMKNLILQLGRTVAVWLLLLSQSMPVQANDDSFTQAELDQMLAPVALYPDTVLTHVLIAATYPLEIVQASRWVKANPGLSGDEAVRAVEQKNWDPSVKALVPFPQLLERLSGDLDWTQQLGEAFLANESQVLASIQTLRQKAYANGTFNDNKHLLVQREREVIVIEPVRKEVIYVPVYDTRMVYGDWWWPSHPPVYWHTAGVYYRHSPFHWGMSVNVRPWFYFGIFDWHQHHVVVQHHYYHTPPRYYPKRHKHYVDARRWHHNTEHRRGVHYRHDTLNREYNAGYGYRQPTREIQGKPERHHRVGHDVTVRENKAHYQRKTAEQINLPNTDWQETKVSPRQHNAALRQQRQAGAEASGHTKQYRNPEPRQQGQQQASHNTVQRYEREERREHVVSTEQLRQREVKPVAPVQHSEQRRERVEQRQAQPRQSAPARQHEQPATREHRTAVTRDTMAQQRSRPAKQIE